MIKRGSTGGSRLPPPFHHPSSVPTSSFRCPATQIRLYAAWTRVGEDQQERGRPLFLVRRWDKGMEGGRPPLIAGRPHDVGFCVTQDTQTSNSSVLVPPSFV